MPAIRCSSSSTTSTSSEADWIIDLGPEGGDGGGRVVFQGPPEKARSGRGHTCKALAEFLKSRGQVLN